MKIFLLVLIAVLAFGVSAEDKIEELEQFEIRSYAPQKMGITDLVFEARIDNLTEILSKNLALGKLIDVSYKIYWISPTSYRVEVNGLPNGFQEIKADLTSLIKGKLEFVLPEKFTDKLKGYTLKSEPLAEGKLIRAIDQTYTMATPEINIYMDKSGQLKTTESKAPMSAVKTDFFYSPKSWSNNKAVLDKIVLTTAQGPANFTTTNTMEYMNINGVGFPSSVTVKNESVVKVPARGKEKEKIIKNESGTVIRFTKYEVNTGKAHHAINAKE